ncbi:accessory gene regulator B family protein [Clostridium sp. C2-6-12]|uniref:accessory gene regulator ArgB-like protein n=1 Tax=Clostridium sp. C2-6-12 TaxID=2698832 RepID=UPI0013691EF6|nr:accessory gene regulator B family protein [Clostridium sp. C2-6-12]
MFRIESVCKKISDDIAKELNLDEDKKSVIYYGLFATTQIGICILLVIIFGAILNITIEALIVSFTISILRKSSGGIHASSPRKCAIISTIISIGMGLICKKLYINISFTILIGVLIFVWSYLTVYKVAPVDSLAKPIKSDKKRNRLKRNSIVILSIYLIIIFLDLLYFYYKKNLSALSYSYCIYMGILWQVFSLTKCAGVLMEKLDKYFK